MSIELDKLRRNIEAMRRVTDISRLVAEEEPSAQPGEEQSDAEQPNPPDQPIPNKSPDADASEPSS